MAPPALVRSLLVAFDFDLQDLAAVGVDLDLEAAALSCAGRSTRLERSVRALRRSYRTPTAPILV